MKFTALMKVTALVSLLIIGACIVLVAWLFKASDDAERQQQAVAVGDPVVRAILATDIYRSGDFYPACTQMISCVGKVFVDRHPKLEFVVMDGGGGSGVTVSGPLSPGKAAFAWTMTTESNLGRPQSCHVDFRYKDATPEEIQAAWNLFEWCGKKQ